ncbi:MAG: hypothetical protein Q7R70_02010 [Candidatus Diapherotrites archaeon]|nr:hypothetical protein [Candidatus Diapherotrites archaeon]
MPNKRPSITKILKGANKRIGDPHRAPKLKPRTISPGLTVNKLPTKLLKLIREKGNVKLSNGRVEYNYVKGHGRINRFMNSRGTPLGAVGTIATHSFDPKTGKMIGKRKW